MVYWHRKKRFFDGENDEEIKNGTIYSAAGAAIAVIGTGSVMMFSYIWAIWIAKSRNPMVQQPAMARSLLSVLLTGKSP